MSGNVGWALTGLLYAPKASVSLAGNVTQSTNGAACFSMVSLNYTQKGSVSIYGNSQSDCGTAGLGAPTGAIGAARQALVK